MPIATCQRCSREHETSDKRFANGDYRCRDCERTRQRERSAAKRGVEVRARPPSLPAEDQYVPVTESGCWLWLGRTQQALGYGVVDLGKRQRQQLAHRYFYEQTYGLIPDGLHACHKCDTPMCVNPDHIFLGDHAANMADRKAKGRYAASIAKRHATMAARKVARVEVSA